MKTPCLLTIALLLAATGLRAEVLPDACGKPDVQFTVKKADGAAPAAATNPGQATVIFMESVNHGAGLFTTPTLRLGLDGDWAGAVRGNTYVTLALTPGEHHFCAAWQSHFSSLRKTVEVMPLTVEAGKSYFVEFKIHIVPGEGGNAVLTELKPINSDQGSYDLKSRALAAWTRKL